MEAQTSHRYLRAGANPGLALPVHQETCVLLFWIRTSKKAEKSTRSLESKKN